MKLTMEAASCVMDSERQDGVSLNKLAFRLQVMYLISRYAAVAFIPVNCVKTERFMQDGAVLTRNVSQYECHLTLGGTSDICWPPAAERESK